MARPPSLPRETTAIVETDPDAELATDLPAELEGIHMPRASIAPFVLAIGFCLAVLGLIINPIILIVGVLWMVAGAIVWIRVGLLEYRAAHSEPAVEAEQTA